MEMSTQKFREGFQNQHLWTGREGNKNGQREQLSCDQLCLGNLRGLDGMVDNGMTPHNCSKLGQEYRTYAHHNQSYNEGLPRKWA